MKADPIQQLVSSESSNIMLRTTCVLGLVSATAAFNAPMVSACVNTAMEFFHEAGGAFQNGPFSASKMQSS
jgi:hypothetical protein